MESVGATAMVGASAAANPSAGMVLPMPDSHLVKIHCLGRFEVFRGGEQIEYWRRSKAKTLLKYLVARHQPVPRDVLIDLLWPDGDPELAGNSLRVVLHALRQTLGGGPNEWVVLEGNSYRLHPRSPIWVDVEEFEANYDAGRRLERGQPAIAMRHYEVAESLYGDDYLIEDMYEEWTIARREELKEQYLMVLGKLADHAAQQGDHEGCIMRCHKILRKDRCREDAHRRLMRSYARLGQRSQALHWYKVCEETLMTVLELRPGEQTRLLHQQILAGTAF